jgi:hypothetical protein
VSATLSAIVGSRNRLVPVLLEISGEDPPERDFGQGADEAFVDNAASEMVCLASPWGDPA